MENAGDRFHGDYFWSSGSPRNLVDVALVVPVDVVRVDRAPVRDGRRVAGERHERTAAYGGSAAGGGQGIFTLRPGNSGFRPRGGGGPQKTRGGPERGGAAGPGGGRTRTR